MSLLHKPLLAYLLSLKRKSIILLALFAVLLVGWVGEDFKTTPYPLNYPANFAGRFMVPAVNPLSKEGVSLGMKLFYEPRLSASNKISCGSCHQLEGGVSNIFDKNNWISEGFPEAGRNYFINLVFNNL